MIIAPQGSEFILLLFFTELSLCVCVYDFDGLIICSADY